MDDTIKKLENMNYEETDAFIKVGKNKMDNNIINDLIKQDEKAYLEAFKASMANYVSLILQHGICAVEIVYPGTLTAKDIWNALPDVYKEQCVPVSFKGQEYIVGKEFYNHLKEVMENEHDKTL